MQAIRLFHLVARWLLVLAEAGGMLWLAALFLALLGWLAWAGTVLLRRLRHAEQRRRAAVARSFGVPVRLTLGSQARGRDR